MFKKNARVLATGLLASTLLIAAGCSGSGDNGDTIKGNVSGNAGGAAAPFTATIYSASVNGTWDDMQSRIGKKITKKTGATLKIEFPVGGATAQKIPLMISSGEYPDMIIPEKDMGKLVDAGAMIDLRPLIDKYGPNIKKVYGEYMNRLVWSKDDDAIYFLPYAGVGGEQLEANGGFQIQHRVLKELGYPNIVTVQDYENAIKTYLDNNPTTDGQPTIGMTLNAGEWQIKISTTNPAFAVTGGSDDGEFQIDDESHEAVYHYLRPQEKEYFRWLNHLFNIGILDKDSFTQKYDQYKSKVSTGRVLGIIDQVWDYYDAEQVLKKEGKFDQTYARFPVTLDASIKRKDLQSTGYLAGYGIGITTSAKHPEELIKMLDYMASDEGQVLRSWGIEGIDYMVEDGMRVIPQEVQDKKSNDANSFKKESGVGNYNFAPMYGDGVLDSSGNSYTTNVKSQIIAAYSDADRETLSHYDAERYLDLWPQADEFPVKAWGAAWNISKETGSELDVLAKKADETMKKRIPEAIMAKPDHFDTVWDNFMKDLDKLGIEKVNDLTTQLVKERIELWK
ncbi:ABC transporter substrate-binding protein [Paenibacillus sp. 2TAB23]|uniref:ABC transporter substrate-binding protein n=1 Tax=Paenibacillus sp. 2TAB23 TaxID=3233004 RepID=UPI003F9C04B6